MTISRRHLLGAGLAGVTLAACGRSSGERQQSSGVSRHVEAYGSNRLQVGEWFVPPGSQRVATVVLLHGGFWLPAYDRHLEDRVASDLASRGYLVWNVDYRPSTAGYPATLLDAAAAYDHLLTGRYADRVDRDRVAVVGHSAGGQLAAWVAARHRLPSSAPGASAGALRPAVVVPQAGVVELTAAAEAQLGGPAVSMLLGGTDQQHPERYRTADPSRQLPTGVRSVLVHGVADDVVPLYQSADYVAAARAAGDTSTLDRVPGGHYVHLDPTTVACARMRAALAAMSA